MKKTFSSRFLALLKPAAFALMAVLFLGQASAYAQPTLNSVTSLIDRGQPEKALKDISTLLTTDPRNEKIYYQQGRAYFEMEDYSNARTSFNRGADLGARFPWNFIGLGAVAAMDNNFATTKENLDKAKGLNASNDVKILNGIANAWLGSGKKEFLDEAKVILYQITITDPNNAEAYIGLGTIYDRTNVNELALSNYEKAVQLDPKYIYGWLRVGQLKKKIKDYKGAAEAFQKAIEIDPTFPPSYKEMAEMYVLAGKYEEAKQNMAKYLELTGNDISARIRFVSLLYYAKEYQNSIDKGRAVLKDTIHPIALRIMGYDFVELVLADSAIKYLDWFLKIAKPASVIPEDYINLARAYDAKKDVDNAVLNYEKAMARGIEKEDPRPDLALNIAETYGAANRYKQQAAALEKYLVGKTPKLKDYFSLGKAYYNDSNYLRSDSVFTKMTEARPELHYGFLWRGRCNANMDPDNKEGKAKPYYEKVIEILAKSEDEKVKNKKDFIEANGYLGSYFLLTKEDCASSLVYWNAIISLDNANKGANDALSYCDSKAAGNVQCSGTDAAGAKCKRKTTDPSGKCAEHRGN